MNKCILQFNRKEMSDRNLSYNRRENSVNSALTGKEGSPMLRRTTQLHNQTETTIRLDTSTETQKTLPKRRLRGGKPNFRLLPPISQTLIAIFIKRQRYSSEGCSLPDLGYNQQPTNAVCCRASARVPLRVLQQATDDRFDVQTTVRLT